MLPSILNQQTIKLSLELVSLGDYYYHEGNNILPITLGCRKLYHTINYVICKREFDTYLLLGAEAQWQPSTHSKLLWQKTLMFPKASIPHSTFLQIGPITVTAVIVFLNTTDNVCPGQTNNHHFVSTNSYAPSLSLCDKDVQITEHETFTTTAQESLTLQVRSWLYVCAGRAGPSVCQRLWNMHCERILLSTVYL